MNIHRRIIGYYRPYFISIIGALALVVASVGLNLLKPWPVKYVVDGLLVEDGKLPWWIPAGTFGGALFTAVLALVLIHLVWGILNMGSNYWLIEIGLRALRRLRAECFEKLHVLSLRFHNHHNSSDLVYRVAYDAQSIQTIFNRGFATIIGSGLTLVGILIVMWQMNVFLTLLSLAVVPFLLGAIFFFAQRVKGHSGSVQEKESRVLRVVNDSLRNLKLIRVMNRGMLEKKFFDEACTQSLDASRALNRTNLGSTLVVGLVTAVGSALLLYFGAGEVNAGNLKVGDLWVFLSYLAMFYQPLEQLSYTAWAVAGALAGSERVFEILDSQHVEDEGKSLPDIPGIRGEIECRDVSFCYEKNERVLSGISFCVAAGETVAFVGGTGAGKTTLLSLIPRLYQQESGSITIDGHETSAYNRCSLRRQMSMVLQDTLLVDGSILDNLRYARPEATEEQCWAALEAAQAATFIRTLSKQMQTDIGEQGVRLSGGQRQRLGIARAILRDSPVLLLDEPTSSLDLNTEADLMGSLKAATSRPTTLIVTHRLKTIHECDRIYVLDGGKIVETGTGPELVERQGIYATLWNR